MSGEHHALYRFFDAAGELLYVGITRNPSARWKAHGRTKEWWTEVARIDLETFDSREAVLAAERAAIRAERPRYNKVHNGSGDLAAPVATPVIWPCQVCGDPIADGTGYLHVPADELRGAEERRRRIEAAKQGDLFWLLEELREHGATAPWLAHHRDCDPNPGAGDYWIPVERVRTARDVLARTAHLMEKEWLSATDWPQILRRAARA